MADYGTILIPTDGSKPAGRGIEHGLGIARDHDAEVHFMRVIDESRYGKTTGLSNYELALEKVEDEVMEELQELADRAESQGLTAATHCHRGSPHRGITGYAEQIDADLIVMGKHGEDESETPHIGSVADRVVRTANCPVFTV